VNIDDQGSATLRVNMTRNSVGVITTVDETMVKLLGWKPSQLIGLPSIQLIHPEDEASAVSTWMAMITTPGLTRVWRGRYQTAAGTWEWIESVNRLEDSDEPAVHSSMTRVAVEDVSVEEELRARTQMLSRLSDALPAGLFEIDAARQIKFTNDRLHLIVGAQAAATIEAQLASVIDEDQPELEAALSAVLADASVDDIEIRLQDPGTGAERVCLLSLRALTDGSGLVSGAIGLLSDVTDRAQLRRELEIRASVDQLTSCLNRAATLDLLATVLARDEATEPGTAVAFIDLDRFKPVNDRFGHAAGDRLLVAVAERLRRTVRGCDRIGRLGGDEFLVICPGVASASAAIEIGERLAGALNATVDIGGDIVDLSASIGVAWTCEPLDPDALIARADLAMYESKRGGRSKVTLYDAIDATVR
jgi:diguanylate cyclase (GGDEF)-like protein/PAS domain S-box-containing protein